MLRNKLELLRLQKNVAWETLELDYVLSWILVGLANYPVLNNKLVFKGGTCLKKCYFGDYRYSQDLDFSAITELADQELEQQIIGALQLAETLVKPYANVQFKISQYLEKAPHPGKQAAFIIRAQLPWQHKPLTKAKIEISRDEAVICKPAVKPILHEYGEELNSTIQVYQLEEVVAEKLRGILQNQERLQSKGWVRSRVRDFYDLWRIFGGYKAQLDCKVIYHIFLKKCQNKGIIFTGAEQFFTENYLIYIKQDWQEFLRDLVPSLPTFDAVIATLKLEISSLLAEVQ